MNIILALSKRGVIFDIFCHLSSYNNYFKFCFILDKTVIFINVLNSYLCQMSLKLRTINIILYFKINTIIILNLLNYIQLNFAQNYFTNGMVFHYIQI